MIRIARKSLFSAPNTLLTTGRAERTALETGYNNGIRVFDFKKEVYGAEDVKNTLIEIQNYKCCFCESRIGHIDDGDVEHFRPKGGYKQAAGTAMTSPGYYWLAYDWDNLFLACTKCNQRSKGNLFPLMETSIRAVNHDSDLDEERPFFIHPSLEDPAEHISFSNESVEPLNGSERGRISIEMLKLDRRPLEDHRAELLSDTKRLFDMLLIISSLAERSTEDQRMYESVIQILQSAQNEKTAETHQYAGMFRCFFRSHPIPSINS